MGVAAFPKPEEITQELVQRVSDAVGRLSGWDFSRLNTVSEPHPWSYKAIVEAYVKPANRVLDVGTGGGELFLSLAHRFEEGVAVDHSRRQITTALANKFINELVGKRTHLNLLEAFSYTPEDFGPHWWQSCAELVNEFVANDCRIVAQGEMNVRVWFTDFESLIFYLKSVPWPDDDNFDLVQRWQNVRRIVERHHSARGVFSNDHYELLIVRRNGG